MVDLQPQEEKKPKTEAKLHAMHSSPQATKKKQLAVALISGGLDSVTLAYFLKSQGFDLHLVSVNYGQRHKHELHMAGIAASKLEAAWDTVDLRSVTGLLKGSSLTDNAVETPDGHYAEDTMKMTVVPNRNMMMLSVAWAIAVAENADIVATAVHGGDHFIYPSL